MFAITKQRIELYFKNQTEKQKSNVKKFVFMKPKLQAYLKGGKISGRRTCTSWYGASKSLPNHVSVYSDSNFIFFI